MTRALVAVTVLVSVSLFVVLSCYATKWIEIANEQIRARIESEVDLSSCCASEIGSDGLQQRPLVCIKVSLALNEASHVKHVRILINKMCERYTIPSNH